MIPLDSYVPKSISALSKTHVDLSSYNGKVYRIPLNQQFIVQFYRKDLLKAAGVAVPTTWSELLSAGRTLTKNGKYGIGLTGTPAEAFDDFLYYMPQAGGYLPRLREPRHPERPGVHARARYDVQGCPAQLRNGLLHQHADLRRAGIRGHLGVVGRFPRGLR